MQQKRDIADMEMCQKRQIAKMELEQEESRIFLSIKYQERLNELKRQAQAEQ